MVKTALIQSYAAEDPVDNLDRYLGLTETAAKNGAKIICLPELFKFRYFPQEKIPQEELFRYAETWDGKTVEKFSTIAEKYHAVIIVPFFEKVNGKFCNSAAVLNSNGWSFDTYRKIHVPYDPSFYEKNYFTAGDNVIVYDTPYAKIAVLICYDQWFPEAAREAAVKGAEIIYYPTAIGTLTENDGQETVEGDWKDAWVTMQRSHAIANSVYVAAVNRCGTEGGIRFWGGSFVAEPFGKISAEAGEDEEILYADIDLDKRRDIASGWGFLRNRRPELYGALTMPKDAVVMSEGYRPDPALIPDTPKKNGFSMPAEWERHNAVWLAFPHCSDTFSMIDAVKEAYISFIAGLTTDGDEDVRLLVSSTNEKRDVSKRIAEAGGDISRVHFYIREYQDVWFRDYGAILLKDKEGNAAGADWIFNAWGGKYDELLSDNEIGQFMLKNLKIRRYEPGIILEGGSVDTNGAGVIMTTEECLLNENRNSFLSKEEIETYLCEYLGADKVIWLKNGIAGDDTDGHIDDAARFVNEHTILCAYTEDKDDPDFEALDENYRILLKSADAEGNEFDVIKLPMPVVEYDDECGGESDEECGLEDDAGCDDEYGDGEDEPLPASYTNFYIANKAVFVPQFGCPQDKEALEIIGRCFPGRKVVGINCFEMVYGCGTLHCISQQEPYYETAPDEAEPEGEVFTFEDGDEFC